MTLSLTDLFFSVVVEERGIFEDLHIDETLIDLIIDTVKTIDFKEVNYDFSYVTSSN